MLKSVLLFWLAAITGFVHSALAQDFPTRPIRLIVPTSSGGGQDTTARAVGQKMGELGQPFVIDNRPGGGGNIAAGLASQAAADGYTLMLISVSSITFPLFYKASYDLVRDFVGVSQLVGQPYLLVSTVSLPVKSVAEMISYAKTNPDKLAYASAGSGSLPHLAMEMLKAQTGLSMIHVPYKGAGAAAADVIGGRVHMGFWSIIAAQPHVKANRVRALGVSGPQRSESAPDIPTIAEAGVPGFSVMNWYGVVAPVRTPRPVVDHLYKAIRASLQDPQVITRVTGVGGDPMSSTPQQFDAYIRAEIERWTRIVKQTGIRIEN